MYDKLGILLPDVWWVEHVVTWCVMSWACCYLMCESWACCYLMYEELSIMLPDVWWVEHVVTWCVMSWACFAHARLCVCDSWTEHASGLWSVLRATCRTSGRWTTTFRYPPPTLGTWSQEQSVLNCTEISYWTSDCFFLLLCSSTVCLK